MGQTVLLFAALLIVAYVQAADTTECCTTKTVGGESYKLVDAEEDTASFGCMNSCVYEKIGSQDSRFCFKVGDLEAMCNDIDTNVESEGESSSCVIAGQMYSSWLYRKVPANEISTCAKFCCESNVCNYWSYGSVKNQKHCYLYSQVFGNPTTVKGFSSGLKGCPDPGPMLVPEPCLLTNTKITNQPTTTVPEVSDYVECQKQCAKSFGSFWSFGDASNQGAGPGTCLIFSTASQGETEYNPKYITGPAACPKTDGICKSSSDILIDVVY